MKNMEKNRIKIIERPTFITRSQLNEMEDAKMNKETVGDKTKDRNVAKLRKNENSFARTNENKLENYFNVTSKMTEEETSIEVVNNCVPFFARYPDLENKFTSNMIKYIIDFVESHRLSFQIDVLGGFIGIIGSIYYYLVKGILKFDPYNRGKMDTKNKPKKWAKDYSADVKGLFVYCYTNHDPMRHYLAVADSTNRSYMLGLYFISLYNSAFDAKGNVISLSALRELEQHMRERVHYDINEARKFVHIHNTINTNTIGYSSAQKANTPYYGVGSVVDAVIPDNIKDYLNPKSKIIVANCIYALNDFNTSQTRITTWNATDVYGMRSIVTKESNLLMSELREIQPNTIRTVNNVLIKMGNIIYSMEEILDARVKNEGKEAKQAKDCYLKLFKTVSFLFVLLFDGLRPNTDSTVLMGRPTKSIARVLVNNFHKYSNYVPAVLANTRMSKDSDLIEGECDKSLRLVLSQMIATK